MLIYYFVTGGDEFVLDTFWSPFWTQKLSVTIEESQSAPEGQEIEIAIYNENGLVPISATRISK